MRHVPNTFRALQVCGQGTNHEASESGSRPRGGRLECWGVGLGAIEVLVDHRGGGTGVHEGSECRGVRGKVWRSQTQGSGVGREGCDATSGVEVSEYVRPGQ